MPISPKYAQAISGGSFQLQVTMPPGSDCTNVAVGAPTKSSLSLKWTTVVAGKVKTVSTDKIKTGVTFTQAPAGNPITVNAVTPPIANVKSLFNGKHFTLKMVMDENPAAVTAACSSAKGIVALHFTGVLGASSIQVQS